MNKKTKYYFLIKNIILFFIFNLGLGLIKNIFGDLLVDNGVDSILIIINTFRVLLVVGMVLGGIVLGIMIVNYFSSLFYRDYRIGIFEAMYYGFADIYQVYDKVRRSAKVQDVQVDFKRTIIYFAKADEYYALKFIDLFGKIEGKVDSEFWSLVSKPKKKYNQIVYTKKERFANPYRENADFIQMLKLKTEKTYKNIVVISGFYKISTNNKSIIAPHEIVDILM